MSKLENLKMLKNLYLNDCGKLTFKSVKNLAESKIIDLEKLEISKGLQFLSDSMGNLIKKKIYSIKGWFIND